MDKLLALVLATFWVTHLHVYFIAKYKIKLPVRQWETCYHCAGFWYAILIYFLLPEPAVIGLAACSVVYFSNSLLDRAEHGN